MLFCTPAVDTALYICIIQILWCATLGDSVNVSFDEQLDQFQSAVSQLTRLYQFRGREEAFNHDLSVSQAYLITILGDDGEGLPMGVLSSKLQLDNSSTTRAVDVLVERGLVERVSTPSDRRVVNVKITCQGKAVHRRIQRDWLSIHQRVLVNIPKSSRQAVIDAMLLLTKEISTYRSGHD